MSELSLFELDSELSASLPARNLMRRHKKQAWGWFPGSSNGSNGASAGAHASFGSAANSNATYQVNFNPQIVINNGNINDGGIKLDSFNTNSNDNTQTGTPINFGVGL